MTDRELALRAEIMRSFAETGEPPEVPASEELQALAERPRCRGAAGIGGSGLSPYR